MTESGVEPDGSEQAEQSAEKAAPQSLEEAMAAMSPVQLRKLRLTKLAALHLLVWMASLGLFAAADSWQMLSDLALAGFFAAVAGILAGIVNANVFHEWGHFIGARRSGGEFEIPDKMGLFVYDWNFKNNTVDQFQTMSRAGTIGGFVALLVVWSVLPTDTLARAGVFAGTVASIVFGARIEWPVLRRVREGGEPLVELSKIDQNVLQNSFLWAAGAGLLTLWWVAP